MNLFWPGDHRAGDEFSDESLLRALLEVERAWLAVLVESAAAPPAAAHDLREVVGPEDLERIGIDAEADGNPVVPLVALLRSRLPEPTRTWLHRGMTSQDVIDSALMLQARRAVSGVRREITGQVDRLQGLIEDHPRTMMTGRTLTQAATPIPFSAKVAGWLGGILDADDQLHALEFPVQLGGASGTLSGLTALAGVAGARSCRDALPRALGLSASTPWHTRRAPVTRIGEAAVTTTTAWGRIANDVLVLGRPEVAEVTDGSAGASSTLPHKANPISAVLLRRAALTAPAQVATLHLAAASHVDERADGAWHAEWAPFATLLRHTVTAAGQATALLRDLQVHPAVMTARLEEGCEAVLAEGRMMHRIAGGDDEATMDPGLSADFVEEVLRRAAHRPRPADHEDTP